MFLETAEVLWNKHVAPGYFKIGLQCHPGYGDAVPGQFVMLRQPDRLYPLLRRPFSIHGLIQTGKTVEGIEILYKVVGKGTQALSLCRRGDGIDLMGPLGNGFLLSENCRRIFLVAGGIGVAPLVFLASALRKKNFDLSTCRVFLGGKSKNDLLCVEDFVSFGMNVEITTDDGSAGGRCLVTQPLETAISRTRPDIIYACGPMGMLRCLAALSEKTGIPCQISVEAVMACGMGTCLGCAVEARSKEEKYLHACMDGPVFDAGALVL